MNIDLDQYYHSGTRILWHAAFWIFLLLYHSVIYSINTGEFMTELMWEGIALPVKMGATYFTLYFLLPRFFMNKAFIKFILYAVVVLLLAAFLQRVTEYTIINWFINPYESAEVFFFPSKILKAVIGIYPVVALAAFIKIGKHWYERDRESQQLEKDKLEAELKFLRAQIHPHFLFNTLNNLYALTLKKSDHASEVVLKLSDLLNYMLYECNEWTVPLDKELQLVETYISLEQIRYGDRLNLDYRVEGNTGDKEIPPLLLLPFIENSFKHGASRDPDEVSIDIDISVQDSRFRLEVTNDKRTFDDNNVRTGYEEGIGLTNVKRRMELLYNGHYSLQISDKPGIFQVQLTLSLDKVAKPGEQ